MGGYGVNGADAIASRCPNVTAQLVCSNINQLRKGGRLKIYCTGCEQDVDARLTNGKERYPHRPDLYDLPFWKCDACGNYVGCHHKSSTPTKPLGVIATPEILEARKKIHALLDPLWKSKRIKRGQAYAYVSHRLGHQYHNGEIRTMAEAREIYKIVAQLHNELLAERQNERNKPTKKITNLRPTARKKHHGKT